MTIRVVAFDVDGTLSDHDKSINKYVSDKIRELDEKGIRIILISGKNISYLSGLARGLGISEPLVIGENGCIILEPNKQSEVRLAVTDNRIEMIKDKVTSKYDDMIWVQPNAICLTIFPKNKETIDEIYQYIINITQDDSSLSVFKHPDAIDVLPSHVNKGAALHYIKEKLGIQKHEVIAVGDSQTDIYMSPEVQQIFLIGHKVGAENAVHFDTIDQALEALGKSV